MWRWSLAVVLFDVLFGIAIRWPDVDACGSGAVVSGRCDGVHCFDVGEWVLVVAVMG